MLVSSLDLAPASAGLSGFSIHPDGKLGCEGFEHPREKLVRGAGGAGMTFVAELRALRSSPSYAALRSERSTAEGWRVTGNP